MAIEGQFVRAAKALASLHICTGSCAAQKGYLFAIHASS